MLNANAELRCSRALALPALAAFTLLLAAQLVAPAGAAGGGGSLWSLRVGGGLDEPLATLRALMQRRLV